MKPLDEAVVAMAKAHESGDIAIVRDPQYNVATWNLTSRRATGRAPYQIEINGKPLVFYHFSGFDNGSQKAMLDRYGYHSPVLFELRDIGTIRHSRPEVTPGGTRAVEERDG